MSIWKRAQDFVELALSIDQYLPGYVDAYYGPAEIRQALENKEKIQLVELTHAANELADGIAQDNTLEASRKEYLQGEVGAMQTTLDLLQGVSIGIIEEVQSLYGLTPQWVDESIFLEAHKNLEELLPGSEPLADRMHAFRTAFEVKGETPRPIIQRLFKELREQTTRRFSLPEGESCEFEFVTDQPWSAYNWYLGDYKSRIDFNLDLPIRVYNLPHLIAHEGYPGHHTEHAIKEKRLYQDDGRLEHSILPSNTPAAVISEGIAEAALELICSPEEQVDYYQQIIAETNIKGYNGQLISEITQLYRQSLSRVSDNQLLLLHQEAAPDEEVIAYGQRYALTSEKQERQSLKFAKDPLWRSYGFNYNLGYEIITGLLASVDDKDDWFTRLLQEPVTPTQVLRWTEQSRIQQR
jgi:hypothetical protein